MRISDWSSDVCSSDLVGTHGYTRFNGTVNVPLAPRLSARATYSFNNREGFSRNETLGRKVADQESHFVRGKIKYEGDAFDIVLSGDYNKITGHEQLRSEEHTSELQSLMRISYAVFCLKKKK